MEQDSSLNIARVTAWLFVFSSLLFVIAAACDDQEVRDWMRHYLISEDSCTTAARLKPIPTGSIGYLIGSFLMLFESYSPPTTADQRGNAERKKECRGRSLTKETEEKMK